MRGRSRVVILNGAPSSGKTTIATAFRDQRAAAGDFWLLIGIDDFLAKIPYEGRAQDPTADCSQPRASASRSHETGRPFGSGTLVGRCSAPSRRG